MAGPILLEETWRWFGPKDPISLADIKQGGVTGIVTALHEVPIGDLWTEEAINARKAEIEAAGMYWSVVESVPVHESIKLGNAERDGFIETYKQCVRNLGKCGVTRLCYNFMPVLDWTRTDLSFDYGDGKRALRYDSDEMAVFDICILKREGAEAGYSSSQIERAKGLFAGMSAEKQQQIQDNVLAGLPGMMVEAYTLETFRGVISQYSSKTPADIRANLAYFLRAVAPVAEEAGVYLCIHPDDPPRPILGLPPAVSTADDIRALLATSDSKHNGITMCVGTYASSPANDVEAMVEEFASRTHFVHLRNVRKTLPPPPENGMPGGSGCTFDESDHLGGDVDMYRVMLTMLKERQRRQSSGWGDAGDIPFRPDHGHQMLDDLSGKKTNPGYSNLGRLRGLAELRGLQLGIARAVLGGAEEAPISKRRKVAKS